MTAAAYLVLVERWVAAWIQDRLGPNRVGIPLTKIRLFGLGQPIADGVKFLCKEQFTPAHVDRLLYFLAPITMFVAAMTVFAVIPFGSVLPADLGFEGATEPIQLVVAPGVDVGMLFVFAVGSIAVYGVLLGGWASNNKYSFLGGLRSGGPTDFLRTAARAGHPWRGAGGRLVATRYDHPRNKPNPECGTPPCSRWGWRFSSSPVSPSRADCRSIWPRPNRNWSAAITPNTPASKLMMFLVGEYLHMFTASFLIVILFFGGWHLWGLTGGGNEVTWSVAILRVVVLLGKVFADDPLLHGRIDGVGPGFASTN